MPPCVPASDVDIVISGLVQPSRLTGGFSPADKRFVTKVLDKVAREVSVQGGRGAGGGWVALDSVMVGLGGAWRGWEGLRSNLLEERFGETGL